MNPNRREFLQVAGASVLAGYAGWSGGKGGTPSVPRSSAVTVVKAATYSVDLVDCMVRGIRACGLDVKDLNILLKPNLVEFDAATCINTDVSVVAAALEAFRSLGAASVRIGEGPGHRRDTYAIAEMARYRGEIPKFDQLFTDLNRDDVSAIQGFADRGEIYLPNTALRAELVVSLAKMKTHHWAGATLSMKNFFGLVPGCVYGWPKNELHLVGIPESIVELNRIFRRSFAIVDGIVGMEGNGPIQGTPKTAGVLVMGSDLPAVDATCCRIMGIDPGKVEYLQMASDRLGVVEEARVEQRGESIRSVRTNFGLIKEFEEYRLG
ncbi:MAG TPA: DUF362 domain-containing protein [Bryobacteraceae bacterium]|jgi:uncharacterized protein (DUF362 family)|nr:DUF362 domain-containing protein [Bryobacteraceae bacterium]